MSNHPVCSQCGQDEEFLVSPDNRYLCLCGHQFSVIASTSQKSSRQELKAQELNITQAQAITPAYLH
ncbi:hypothetical protein L4D09_16880 [Photobacterium makurazakiensis]|uniref:hypothetical protein n=1 Tax=Photobacterium TaxID=657 RepID=UPI003D146CC6